MSVTRQAKARAQCVFEHVYFSRPDSTCLRPSSCRIARTNGPSFWRAEHPVDADVIVPVPILAVVAALGFSAESGIPFRQALIRNHYVGRTFIEPSQVIRDFGVKLKLKPDPAILLEGESVLYLWTTRWSVEPQARKIVRMVRSAGAREVHLRISCPPTISPCYYGVDTPSEPASSLHHKHSVEDIRRYVEADSLGYLSLEFLKNAVADSDQLRFCYACYTGKYPTPLIQIEDLAYSKC